MMREDSQVQREVLGTECLLKTPHLELSAPTRDHAVHKQTNGLSAASLQGQAEPWLSRLLSVYRGPILEPYTCTRRYKRTRRERESHWKESRDKAQRSGLGVRENAVLA
ncbi:hypothetical protein A6R68_09270, partial [Neotoma lepida]